MSDLKNIGDFGERMAAAVLLRNGYKIRGTQVRTPFGEIDIVAESPREVIFVEVKTRRTMEYGRPEEAITREKQEHLARAVESYRAAQNLLNKNFRVDAIVVLLDKATKKASIRRIKNILEDLPEP